MHHAISHYGPLPRCRIYAVSVSSSRCAFVQSSTNTPTFSVPNECAASFPFCPCLESALQTLQALEDHCLATNPLSRSVSIPSTSTTSHWRRISHFCRFQRAHAKNTVVTNVDSLLRQLSRAQNGRTAQLNAQLTLLEHDLKKESEHAARKSLPMSAARPDGKRNICPQEPKNNSK